MWQREPVQHGGVRRRRCAAGSAKPTCRPGRPGWPRCCSWCTRRSSWASACGPPASWSTVAAWTRPGGRFPGVVLLRRHHAGALCDRPDRRAGRQPGAGALWHRASRRLAPCCFRCPGCPTRCRWAALMLLGLGCAPIYPSLMHEATRRFDADTARRVIGRQVAFAYLGCATGPAALGLLGAWAGLVGHHAGHRAGAAAVAGDGAAARSGDLSIAGLLRRAAASAIESPALEPARAGPM